MPAAVTYTTTPEVRTESGFQYNTDITDSVIDSKRLAAFSIINSKVGSRYSLPLSNNPNFTDSPAQNLMGYIELLYASWNLLITEYWNEAIWSDKDGYKKQKAADDMLNDILSWKLLLLDTTWSELLTNVNLGETQTVRLTVSWSPTNSDNKKFSMSKTF
jgi:hypothetical protein